MSTLDVPHRPQSEASTAVPSVIPTPDSVSEKEQQQERPSSQPVSVINHEDESQYPGPGKLAMITVALCLVVFLVALDQTIIATAIPKITDQFEALDDIGWYGSAYMLTMCSFQLIYGRLYTFFNLKYTFLGAIFIFEVGSLICGVAPDSTVLIVGRAIAGLGCSGIFSGAILILSHSVPLRKRPTYTGLVGAMFGIASVAGPLMGGAFTDTPSLTWRWCFYINLPIGAVTIGVIWFFFESPVKDDPEILNLGVMEKLKRFDFVGTALLLPAVVCLLLALQWGGSTYAWSNWRVILCLVLFGVLATAFTVVQIMLKDRATIPTRIIKQRSVAIGALIAFCIGAGFFILIFFIPIWFQAIKGVSAVKSGIMNLPLILGVVLSSVLGGICVTLIGYYTPLIIIGTAIGAIGTGLLITFETNTGSPKWIGYQYMAGAGVGMAMQLPLIAVQTVLPAVDQPTGTAIVVFGQSLGGALFISVGQNVFNNKLVQGLASVVPDLSPAAILSAGATGLKNVVPAERLGEVLWCYNDAITSTFIPAVAITGVGFLLSFGMEWKSVKGKKIEMTAA